jgi:phage terminase large subunit-like protein
MAVFRDVYYGNVPAGSSVRYAIGVDLAYTEKTYADWSTAVLVGAVDSWVHEDDGSPAPGPTPYNPRRKARQVTKFYVLKMFRRQVTAPKFLAELMPLQERLDCPVHWIASGTEKGTAQFIRHAGLRRFHVSSASTDKFMRAQPVAAAWNAGLVPLPDLGAAPDSPQRRELEENLKPFVNEVLGFTGVGDKRDDYVDALAAAHAVLARKSRFVDLS